MTPPLEQFQAPTPIGSQGEEQVDMGKVEHPPGLSPLQVGPCSLIISFASVLLHASAVCAAAHGCHDGSSMRPLGCIRGLIVA